MGIYPKDGNWYIDYRYQGQRYRECVGPSKRLAEQALNVRKTEILQERYQIKKTGAITFEAFAKTYLEYAKTDKASWATDEHRLKHLLPFFGNRLLRDITPLYIESYKKKRAEVVKKATVNRELVQLKRMINLAIKWEMAAANPMRDVRLFKEEPVPERVLNQEEIARLLGACTPYSRGIVLTAIHTGMRRGEILGLKWEQVDLREKVITVLHTKTGKVRKIPINHVLWETLKGLKEKSKSEYVFVCDKTGGQPIHKFQHAWLNALERAGIPRCRFHDLRHTFASTLVANGWDLVTVKDLLGHSSIIMTTRYAHSAPETKRRAIAALEGLFGSQDAESGHFLDTEPNLEKKAVVVSR